MADCDDAVLVTAFVEHVLGAGPLPQAAGPTPAVVAKALAAAPAAAAAFFASQAAWRSPPGHLPLGVAVALELGHVLPDACAGVVSARLLELWAKGPLLASPRAAELGALVPRAAGASLLRGLAQLTSLSPDAEAFARTVELRCRYLGALQASTP